jgi:hypothetical protein
MPLIVLINHVILLLARQMWVSAWNVLFRGCRMEWWLPNPARQRADPFPRDALLLTLLLYTLSSISNTQASQ